ncbi:MAG TPA: hypothetical protein DGG95_16125 [Cytophagales bacterium]|nr:hypothetical protein [Cytophagales bacterium]
MFKILSPGIGIDFNLQNNFIFSRISQSKHLFFGINLGVKNSLLQSFGDPNYHLAMIRPFLVDLSCFKMIPKGK